VAARHHVDRIELQDAQPAQYLPHPVDTRGRRRAGQVLAADGEPPRFGQAQRQVDHSAIVPRPPWR
jgi:hypothetical protein